ncbi:MULTISPECIES: DUF1611 domain-containing protein [Halolamina]|uniref:Uncharacterized conserved protein, NAD-dependent epimerase/dehydratase family n=1 Tax=Halolamina pelagica TaxID=699431 RepID=A0A1I5TNR0_9EURY|nr:MULTISPECIES: DUF1611 domain-containing protein [Halolamina]NHX37749.1 DUF1611 domain-containing protein [Halolamina sp. R1-12]SFP84675.1 Uncharacterized conserved protein, NAD-dependent epimerase/dehydratase family [Halolamina pelagica]
MNLRDVFDVPVPAIVLAEGEFGETGGKTANGVVMHSEVFDTRAIVDTDTAGRTPADVLGKPDAPEVPIVESVEAALDEAPEAAALVIGVAPAGGELPEAWITDMEDAIRAGCDIVSGLHVFLGEEDRWKNLADQHGVRLFDVRKPPADDDLRVGDGSVDDVNADVVLTLGTDCAVGKRTTTFELYQAARAAGLDAGWVATGQTGIMVGAHEGVVVDRVPADFTAGVVEDLVTAVGTDHDLVFVEGQASLTHRAYSGVTLSILHGAWPDAVVLADEPVREGRTHFERFQVEGVEKEVRLIEDLSDARVAALSTWGDPDEQAERYGLPASNVYHEGGASELLSVVRETLRDEKGVHLEGTDQ